MPTEDVSTGVVHSIESEAVWVKTRIIAFCRKNSMVYSATDTLLHIGRKSMWYVFHITYGGLVLFLLYKFCEVLVISVERWSCWDSLHGCPQAGGSILLVAVITISLSFLLEQLFLKDYYEGLVADEVLVWFIQLALLSAAVTMVRHIDNKLFVD